MVGGELILVVLFLTFYTYKILIQTFLKWKKTLAYLLCTIFTFLYLSKFYLLYQNHILYAYNKQKNEIHNESLITEILWLTYNSLGTWYICLKIIPMIMYRCKMLLSRVRLENFLMFLVKIYFQLRIYMICRIQQGKIFWRFLFYISVTRLIWASEYNLEPQKWYYLGPPGSTTDITLNIYYIVGKYKSSLSSWFVLTLDILKNRIIVWMPNILQSSGQNNCTWIAIVPNWQIFLIINWCVHSNNTFLHFNLLSMRISERKFPLLNSHSLVYSWWQRILAERTSKTEQ